MDIGVLPMISSSIPNKIFDYIAAYLPILVLGNSDSALFVKDQSIGWNVGYNSDEISIFFDNFCIEDLAERKKRISKIRDLYDRDYLFQQVKQLIES